MDLTISPEALAKASAYCKLATGEISGRLLTRPDDPYHVVDVVLVQLDEPIRPASVSEDVCKAAAALIDYEDEGFLTHIWWHTHPGNSASPSSVDWKRFDDEMGLRDIFGMAILAQGGDTTFHLGVKDPYGHTLKLDCGKWKTRHAQVDEATLKAELEAMIEKIPKRSNISTTSTWGTTTRNSSWGTGHGELITAVAKDFDIPGGNFPIAREANLFLGIEMCGVSAKDHPGVLQEIAETGEFFGLENRSDTMPDFTERLQRNVPFINPRTRWHKACNDAFLKAAVAEYNGE